MPQADTQTEVQEDGSSTPRMTLLLPPQGTARRDWVRIEHDTRPSRLHTEGGRELFPDWDRARDDAGVLRRCVLCGEEHMFRRKRLPQLTGLVVVLAFTLAMLSILGYVGGPVVLACMVAVLVLDLGILLFSPESLECYGCHAEYRDLKIGGWHKPWNRAMGRRFTPTEPILNAAASSSAGESTSPTESNPPDQS